jgi:hypothetical protein
VLPDGEYKGVVDREARALWLGDVQVMTLSMRGWMSNQEVVRRVLSMVNYWQSKCQRMGIGFDGMLDGMLVMHESRRRKG